MYWGSGACIGGLMSVLERQKATRELGVPLAIEFDACIPSKLGEGVIVLPNRQLLHAL